MYNAILVDDEVRTIDALERNIEWRNCGIRKVFKATSMKQAISLMTEEKIEILICDIEMPNGSGLQLLEWLREHDRKINCIFVTCHPEFAMMRKAIQLNCYDYVLKPINYEEFSLLLGELVRKMEVQEMQSGKKKADWSEVSQSVTLDRENAGSERNVELEVKKFIKNHMSDNITVSDIAEELHFNPQYLMRMFKNKTGLSILEYMTRERLHMAKQILKTTNLPIKIVSNMVGYEDYAYFTRVFKKEIGESPTAYRNRHI